MIIFCYSIQPPLHLVMASLLPFVLLAVIGVAIVIKIRHINLKQHGSRVTAGVRVSRMTVMMITVAGVFLLLTAPYKLFMALVYAGYYNLNTTVRDVTTKLWMLNYVINFYIYSLSNPRFRKELVSFLKICHR